MFPWKFACIAAVVLVIALMIKIAFLYQGLKEIGEQFHDRLGEDTNNVIYVSGNDRHLKAFARQMNQELAVLYGQRRKYQNGDRELKEAVTNISHDLRTPLTAVYGYLELLDAEMDRAAVPLPNQMARYLAQIRNRADAMHALTEELFRYSIILSASRGNTGYQRAAADPEGDSGGERVVLNRFLADCLLSYYDIFMQNGIEPQIAIADEDVVRFLDTGALKRVFCNILDNAVKYSKPVSLSDNTVLSYSSPSPDNALLPDSTLPNDGVCSGRAVLYVELFQDGTVTFRNRAQNLDWVSVERLFDRFYTVETGRNSTGLGLSIAKVLTEHMGGSISAVYADGMLEIIVKL